MSRAGPCAAAKFGWNTVWKLMMTELAPQDSEGGYNRPKYDFPKDPLADETVVSFLSTMHCCFYQSQQTGFRTSQCTVDSLESMFCGLDHC